MTTITFLFLFFDMETVRQKELPSPRRHYLALLFQYSQPTQKKDAQLGHPFKYYLFSQ